MPFVFYLDTELPEIRNTGNYAKCFTSHIQQIDFSSKKELYLSCVCCFIFNILTLEVGWLHLDML